MAKAKTGRSPAVEIAKGQEKPNTITVLSTGVRARLLPVPAPLLDQIGEMIPDPEIPVQYIEDKDRHEPNPYDPEYLKKLREAYRARAKASLDAFVMFGVELAEEIPPDSEWVPKLRFMERRGALDLSGYDLSDQVDREFVYKMFVAVGNADLIRISALSGVSQEEVRRAADSFRGDEEGTIDPGSEAEE